jgi:hypothetical protein
VKISLWPLEKICRSFIGSKNFLTFQMQHPWCIRKIEAYFVTTTVTCNKLLDWLALCKWNSLLSKPCLNRYPSNTPYTMNFAWKLGHSHWKWQRTSKHLFDCAFTFLTIHLTIICVLWVFKLKMWPHFKYLLFETFQIA